LVRPDILGRCSKQTILSASEREKEEVCCCVQPNASTEQPNLPLLEEETPILKHVNV
jgi:hypothetical protein